MESATIDTEIEDRNRVSPPSYQCCQPWDFIPRSWDFFGTLGFSWDFYFKNKTLGFFLGFFRIQKIILNINFLILINLLVRESYPVINIIR